MILFHTDVKLNRHKFTNDDFMYLIKKVISSRAAMSDNKQVTVINSGLFEAVKTMLMAISYLSSILNINHINIFIDDQKMSDEYKYPTAIDDIITKNGTSVVKFTAKIDPSYYIDDIISGKAIGYLANIEITGILTFTQFNENSIHWSGFTDSYSVHDLTKEEEKDENDYPVYMNSYKLNSNGIYYYSENYPMPSVYLETIEDKFIRSIIDFAKTKYPFGSNPFES